MRNIIKELERFHRLFPELNEVDLKIEKSIKPSKKDFFIKVIEFYTGRKVIGNIEYVQDSKVDNTYAVRCILPIGKEKQEVVDWLFVHVDDFFPSPEHIEKVAFSHLEEVEFETWPPKSGDLKGLFFEDVQKYKTREDTWIFKHPLPDGTELIINGTGIHVVLTNPKFSAGDYIYTLTYPDGRVSKVSTYFVDQECDPPKLSEGFFSTVGRGVGKVASLPGKALGAVKQAGTQFATGVKTGLKGISNKEIDALLSTVKKGAKLQYTEEQFDATLNSLITAKKAGNKKASDIIAKQILPLINKNRDREYSEWPQEDLEAFFTIADTALS